MAAGSPAPSILSGPIPCSAVTGARSSITRSCISRSATIRRSILRLSGTSRPSRPVRRVSTSSRAAIFRKPLIRRITLPTPVCAGPSTSICGANAPMWRRRRANSPRPDHFAKTPTSHPDINRIPGDAMPTYDPNNPFAKILRGEFPCYKVYEDDHVAAFVDIMPRCPGHTLVIPKAPARNILDISAEDFAHVARGGRKIARAAMTAFTANGITVQQFSEPAGGQVVFHLHMHVMPRYQDVALLPPASRKEDGKVLEDHAAKLIEALKGG